MVCPSAIPAHLAGLRRELLLTFSSLSCRVLLAAVTLLAIAFTSQIAGAAVPKALEEARAACRAEYPVCKTTPEVDNARGAHKSAKAAFARGEYESAVLLWKQAYRFDCTKPEVFRNISNAYEKYNEKAAALALLELYIEREAHPDPAAIDKAKTMLQELEAHANRAAPAASPAADPRSRAPSSTTSSSTAASMSHGSDNHPTATGSSATDTPEERPYGVAPWLVFGSGLALAGAGIPMIVVGTADIAEGDELCNNDRDQCKSEKGRAIGNRGLTVRGIGIALAATGGAGVLAGLIWQFAANQPQRVATTNGIYVAPLVGPDSVGAMMRTSF